MKRVVCWIDRTGWIAGRRLDSEIEGSLRRLVFLTSASLYRFIKIKIPFSSWAEHLTKVSSDHSSDSCPNLFESLTWIQ